MRSHRPLLAALATVAAVALLPGTASAQVTWPEGTPADDPELACIEPVPASTSVKGVTDAGQTVQLSTRVLLDGVDLATAQRSVARAADSYAPLGVTLTATYEAVSFSGDDAQGLIDQAKARYGGARPAGVDVVHVLTTKDIQDGGEKAVVGLADCIGGVRYSHRAFSVAEVGLGEGSIGPLRLDVDSDAETTTHELGHLLGAHHHYANCVEGVADGDSPTDVSPCTVMFNAVNPASLWFGRLEGSVVLGHALRYATP